MSTSFSISLWSADAVSWAFGGVGIALTLGRYAIRWKVTRQFWGDDIAHLVAVGLMVAALACYHVLIPTMNDFYAFSEQEAPENDALFDWMEGMSAAFHILFFTSLWCVKLAFLLFYRTLFKVSHGFVLAWWIVLAFNFATYWMAIAGSLLPCNGQVSELSTWQVCEGNISNAIVTKIYIFTFVAVLSSDLAVIILPLAMLRGLHMQWSTKCSIGGIFCLSFISVAFELLRFVKSYLGGDTLNILWMNLEMTVAVITSALPTYYSLMTRRRAARSSRKYDYSDGTDLKSSLSALSGHRFARMQPSYQISTQSSDATPPQPFETDGIIRTNEVRVDVARYSTLRLSKELAPVHLR